MGSYLEVIVVIPLHTHTPFAAFVRVEFEAGFSEAAVRAEVTEPGMEPSQPPSTLTDRSSAFIYWVFWIQQH